MRHRLLRSALVAASLVGVVLPGQVVACAFHTELPEETLSQQIAGSVALLAARPTKDDPFRFSTGRWLKGEPSSDMPPYLVDAGTRRLLSEHPDQAVLFGQDDDGDWTRLILLDETTMPVVDHMLAQADRWATPDGATQRRDFAASLLAHSDARLHSLALRELDALDYRILRRGEYPVAAADLLDGLSRLEDQAYTPIRILLLGIVGGDRAGEETSRQMSRRLSAGLATNLGAWSTAAIEIGGVEAISELERLIAASHRRLEPEQLVEIVRALAVQGASGELALRERIRTSLLRLAEDHPAAAPMIPAAFMSLSDWSQSDLVQDLVAARAFTSRNDLLAATAYLANAHDGAARGIAAALTNDRLRQPASSVAD